MNGETAELIESLRAYLEDLQDSGVDALPFAVDGVNTDRTEAVEAAGIGDARRETLEEIRAELGDCCRCELGGSRKNLVFGVGNPHARIVFVGEAPGRDEDLKGEPFVGEAGQLLTKIIQAMGFERSDVYICNVLKCRPPGNRDPLPSEVEVCGSFMLRQVKAINPEAVVALGKFAAQTLLQSKEIISRLRGKFHDYHGIPLMPTFHPSALLRDPAKKREVWEDMQKVMKLVGKEAPQKKG
jgi:uracil-DNA glycosylase